MKFKNVKSSVSCIYRITFPDGKYYVGQTKNLAQRVRLYERCVGDASDNSRVVCALRACGVENVDIDILCSVTNMSGDNLSLCLSILEIKYIKETDCIYPKGYNASIGGELLGIPADVIETKFGVTGNGVGCRPVLVYNLDGVFVSEYASISRCAYGLGVSEADITSVLNKRGKLLRNTYMLREKKFGVVPDKIIPFEPEVVKKTEYEVVTEKVFKEKEIDNAAIMYDANGEYVGLFESASRSKQYLGLRPDWKVPFGREFRGYYLLHYSGGEIKKSLGAFTSSVLTTILYDDVLALGDIKNIGEKISFQLPEQEDTLPQKVERAVNKYTLDGEYIETYTNLAEAAVANESLEGSIRACCNRKTKTSGGFIYRFADDDKPVVMAVKLPSTQSKSEDGGRKYRRVNQYTLGGKFVRSYDSVVEAARLNGVFASGIRACCNGKVSRCGNFRYLYADNDDCMSNQE